MTERSPRTIKRSQSGVRIAGTGMAIPSRVLTNDDLAKMVDTNDEWITQRVGIKTRHIADESTSVRDLARDALKQALDNAAMEPGDLDMVLVATLTPEEHGMSMRWMLPSLTPSERLELMAGMRNGAPVQVFCAAMEALRDFLDARQWELLAGGLGYESQPLAA